MDKQRFQKDLKAALAVVDRIHRDPTRYRGHAIVIPLGALSRGTKKGLTPARLRVLDVLRNNGPFETLEALAAALRRPASRVSRDVRILEELELVWSEKSGRRKGLRADTRPILLA